MTNLEYLLEHKNEVQVDYHDGEFATKFMLRITHNCFQAFGYDLDELKKFYDWLGEEYENGDY